MIDLYGQCAFPVLVYILLPGFVLIAMVALLYICCAKRYRLNWFERSLIEQSTGGLKTSSVTAQDQDEKTCIISSDTLDNEVIKHGSTSETKLPISVEITNLPDQIGTISSTPKYKQIPNQAPEISFTSGESTDSILTSTMTGSSICDNTELFWVPAAVSGPPGKRASTGLIQIGVTRCESPPGKIIND